LELWILMCLWRLVALPAAPILPLACFVLQGFFRIVTSKAFEGRGADFNLAIELSCGWAVPDVSLGL
jgi:hypothetical protein